MKTLNISALSLAAAQICGLGFNTHVLTKSVPMDTEDPAPALMVDKAIIVVGSENATKYLKVLDVGADGKTASFAIIDHTVHSAAELLALDELTVVGEAITLEQIMAGDIDNAKELLDFKVAAAA